jgi:hypothetical protein
MLKSPPLMKIQAILSHGILAMKFFRKLIHAIFSQENLYALLAFLIFVALALFTASTAPLWIYQGF